MESLTSYKFRVKLWLKENLNDETSKFWDQQQRNQRVMEAEANNDYNN